MNRALPFASCLALIFAAACGSGSGTAPDGGDKGPGEDAMAGDGGAMLDASSATDAGGDATTVDGGAGDAPVGMDAGTPVVGDPVIVRMGVGGFLLRGTVLAPGSVLDPGEVLVTGNTITCVAASCSDEPGAETVTIVDTRGIISPGLVDAHNHVAYNFLPEWVSPTLFDNRYEWAADPDYEAHIEPYAAHRSSGSHYCPAAKWGELRSLIHGTTTIQGQSFEQGCVNRLARNADHFHGLGHDHMQTTIGSVRDITDSDADGYVANFTAASDPTTILAVHMTEGITGNNLDLEFASFAGRDPRMNRHNGISLLAADDGAFRGTGLLIHSMILTDAELMEARDTDSKIAWSPSSNMVLYGATAPIERIVELGITVGLGPDWTLSGEDEMLSEMRFARDWAVDTGASTITAERLFTMATAGGAEAVGLGDGIGQLIPGMRADIAVFSRVRTDPYEAVIENRAADVRLVFVDGQAYYGDVALEAATAVNDECDLIDACGAMKYLCLRNTPGAMTATSRAGETLEDVRVQLYNILEGVGYPADEQYGRGDELLPLIDCGT